MKAHLLSISNFEARGKKALKAFAWAVALVIAVDLSCHALLPSGFLLRIEKLTRERMSGSPAPDIQIVGDSVARSGFLATSLTGDSFVARNDSLPASGPPITYHLLKDQFDSGHIPKALVIAHSPHNFSQFRYAVLIGGFAYWRELPSIVKDYGELGNSAYAVLTRLSYLLMHRDSFQDIVKQKDISFFLEKDEDVKLLTDRSELAIFRKELPQGMFDKSKLTPKVPEFYLEPFKVLDINDRYFRRILALAKSHGVKVFWFTMPVPKQLRDARAEFNYEEDMLKYLRRFEQQGDLKILRAEFVVYDDNLFRDWLHLNLKGAVKLACELRGLRQVVVSELKSSENPTESPGRDGPGQGDADDPQVVLDQFCPSH